MIDRDYQMLARMEAKIDTLIQHVAADHQRIKGLEKFRAWVMKIAGGILAGLVGIGGYHGV